MGYLASYEGMGRARLECRFGCQCAETTLDGHWTLERASISLMHEFYVSWPACKFALNAYDSRCSV